jgi:hypothetical protein
MRCFWPGRFAWRRKLASPARTAGALLDAAAHPGRTGGDHLRVLAAAAGLPGHRADHLLDLVGLAHAARQRAGRYSLGMRQRLALATAVLADPDVLVLDERAGPADTDSGPAAWVAPGRITRERTGRCQRLLVGRRAHPMEPGGMMTGASAMLAADVAAIGRQEAT